jgi:hypothetical protein
MNSCRLCLSLSFALAASCGFSAHAQPPTARELARVERLLAHT